MTPERYPTDISSSILHTEPTKPDIIEVIGQRIDLRRSGKELIGRCPFHADKTPSFSVSKAKQVFHCYGCREGGDVFDFIMMIDGLSFPEAKAALGITSERKSRPRLTARRKRAAELAATWVQEQRMKLNILIAESMEGCDLADEIANAELGEIFDRELIMLRGFYDALESARGAAELLTVQASIEKITADVEIIYEPPPPFPPLTADYRAILEKTPLDFERCFR